MEIRSYDLMNYLRCRRFSALNQPLEENKIIAFDELISDSQQEDDDKEFVSEPSDSKQQIKMLFEQHYLKKREHLSMDLIFRKQFSDNMDLISQIDFFEETDQKLILYKVGVSSSSAFLKMKYTYKKEKYPFFVSTNQSIYQLVPEPSSDDSNYPEKIRKLISRHYPTGRPIYDLAFTCFTIPEALTRNKDIQIYHVLLNHQFILPSDIDEMKDLSNLFVLLDVTSSVLSLQEKIKTDLYRMKNLLSLKDPSPCELVEKECLWNKEFECPFTEICFSHVPKTNNISHYFFSHLGFKEGNTKNDEVHTVYELLNQGFVNMDDIPIAWLQRDKNLMQRFCIDHQEIYVNKKKMSEYLSQLRYPYYFLDFEAYPSPIPRFRKESPYSQSLFQYSLHVLNDASSKLEHFEYLAPDGKDRRLDLLTSLLKNIKDDGGSIIVYNQSFEEHRLLELASVYPEYQSVIENIIARLFDLYKCLKNDNKFFLEKGYSEEEANTYNFYHPDQSGSYSIKKILEVFGDDSYHELNIQNGVMAYEQYRRLDTLPVEQYQKIRKDLLKYCEQDTLSMVIVLRKIESLLQ